MATHEPPGAEPPDPLTEVWLAGRNIHRVYQASYGPTGFNPTASSGRFRPIRSTNGEIIPTAYGAADLETALAEGLLRGVDDRGARRRLYRKEILGLERCVIVADRDLVLARLHGLGLQRLRLRREELIDTEASGYPLTAQWSQALHDAPADVDGLVWTSRQNDSNRALLLFGDRVKSSSFEVIGTPVPLDHGPGLNEVRQVCIESRVDLEA